MFIRNGLALTLAAAAVCAAVCVAGCNGGASSGSSGTGRGPDDVSNDASGDKLLGGNIRIARVDRAPDGSATYLLDNTSSDDLADLSVWINYYYPPDERSAFEKVFDLQPSPPQDLFLTKGETGHSITAANPRPGDQVIATRLEVLEDLPIPVVIGTRFLNNELECVAMSSADDLLGAKPSQWIEVQNASSRKIPAFEAVAVFIDPAVARPGNVKAQAKTMASAMEPGTKQRLTFDLAGKGRLSNYQFFVKVRRIRKF